MMIGVGASGDPYGLISDVLESDGGAAEGARADATAEDIRRALSLYRKAGAGLAALLLLIMALA